MSKAADTPEVSRFDCKVKGILFPKLLLTFLGFIMISLNYQIFPKVFFLSTVWPGNFIKWQNNFVYSEPEKKKCEWSLFKKDCLCCLKRTRR